METFKIFGGNKVKKPDLDGEGRRNLGSGPYEYYFYGARPNEELCFDSLSSFTVYLLSKAENVLVRAQGIHKPLDEGGALQSEGAPVHLSVTAGPARFLIAGTKRSARRKKGLCWTRPQDLYQVSKPWGHELWINGQHPTYAFKQIFVKSGTRTSLQYHNLKQETNFLIRGSIKLHYKNKDVANNAVSPSDISDVQLQAVSTIDVSPGTLHRIEALTDVLLFETSTPHLDDVIRVSDDTERRSGRVKEEHPS